MSSLFKTCIMNEQKDMKVYICTLYYVHIHIKICAFNVYMHIDMLRNIYENLFEN